MVDRVEFPNADPAASRAPEATGPEAIKKKPFIEPRISVPADLLEATTFFQSVESGATN